MSEDGALANGFSVESKVNKESNSKRVMHKTPKNSSSTNRNFFIQFSFAVLVVLAYFLGMFLLSTSYISGI